MGKYNISSVNLLVAVLVSAFFFTVLPSLAWDCPPTKPPHHHPKPPSVKPPPHAPKPPHTPKPPTVKPPPHTPKPPAVKPPPYTPKPPPVTPTPPVVTPPTTPQTPCPPPPSPTTLFPPPPPPPYLPYPSPPGTCPIDILKLGPCVEALWGLMHIGLGKTHAKEACCPVLGGLVDLDAAVCMCNTIKAKLLKFNLIIPIALEVLLDFGKTPPDGFKCLL